MTNQLHCLLVMPLTLMWFPLGFPPLKPTLRTNLIGNGKGMKNNAPRLGDSHLVARPAASAFARPHRIQSASCTQIINPSPR
ncbi:hypothetical protein C8J57DRAFT_138983 [Mycena rebaudengoi]|nr:hypothetical protein C8J57DRAFT_138983 [Mycena rebaudengoi]